MATQSGITIASPNAPYTVVDSIPRPSFGSNQALVKTLYVGLNPVEAYMQHTGLLIESWPAVIGSDVAGIVLEAGADCKKVKKGDYVFGCVPLGLNEFAPFQETFVIEEDWMFKKDDETTVEESATIGAGLLTAALSILDGQNLELPSPGAKAEPKDSWFIVMGGSGTVGQFGTQIASLCGYKVLASCSPSKNEIVLKAGATATLNNRAPIEEQLAEIEKITGGNFGHVFDSSVQATELSFKALETISKEPVKYFSTTDDGSDMTAPESVNLYRVELGKLARKDDIGKHVTTKVTELIPVFEKFLKSGEVKPLSYHLVPGTGWDKVIEAIADMEAGKVAKKIIVKAQDE
jgi:NADPH:quinone reductase-like Zn-dependent oxidoreductase